MNIKTINVYAGVYVKIEKRIMSRCPVKNIIDVSELCVEYYTCGNTLESSSFNNYIDLFYSKKISQEDLTFDIYENILKVLDTGRIKVTIKCSHWTSDIIITSLGVL